MERIEELVIPNSSLGIERAASIIKQGGIVAFPTETVYGLGGNALDPEAVKAIFVAKGRPLTDPLIVHISSKEQGFDLIDITESEREIFDILSLFWPGPLTIIVKASSRIPALVTANTGFVGIRLPNHPLAISLINASQLPIAAPSANRFGHVSPTRAEHVITDLGEKGVPVLFGDCDEYKEYTCAHGIESSVVKIDGSQNLIVILRQGAITSSMIEDSLSKNSIMGWKVVAINRALKMEKQNEDEDKEEAVLVGQEAPGQAITHYAPNISCMIVRNVVNNNVFSCDSICLTKDQLSNTIVIDFGGQNTHLREGCLAYRDLSEQGNSKEAAFHLFDYLRWSESFTTAQLVLLPYVHQAESEEQSILLGLADRLFRAASGKIVNVSLR